jgi:flavin reductase (DIM6/NTAB) family NADH-FMN oxidoreductase RutF
LQLPICNKSLAKPQAVLFITHHSSLIIRPSPLSLLPSQSDKLAETDERSLSMKTSLGADTLIYPTPIWVVGTYDKQGKPNIMTIAWGGICCSKPPCIAISLRKATYSYGNIVERKAFTVNVPSVAYAKQADFCGMVSGRDVDKFAAAGLTPVRSDLVDAPFVQEFPMILECKLVHTIELGLHTQFVG